ncbi:hypothetical protein MO867_22480, partial [Microbulbifer sp. OS29]
MRESLRSTIDLPLADGRTEPRKNDLALELAVIKHQGGEFDGFNSRNIFIPIFWRPTVEVKARLYVLCSGKTVHSAASKRKVSWGKFLSRVFCLNGAVFRILCHFFTISKKEMT